METDLYCVFLLCFLYQEGAGSSKPPRPAAAWERSIGSSVSSKASMMKLVKCNRKKAGNSSGKDQTGGKGQNSVAEEFHSACVDVVSECNQKTAKETAADSNESRKKEVLTVSPAAGPHTGETSALSMLGNYSDSEESDT